MPPKQEPSDIKVNSPTALQILLADGEPKDFFIQLGDAGYESRKVLSLAPDGTFRCYSEIEDVDRGYPTFEEMLEDSCIGLAIRKGCFFLRKERFYARQN